MFSALYEIESKSCFHQEAKLSTVKEDDELLSSFHDETLLLATRASAVASGSGAQ